jgi:hypothetical protein
MATIKGTNVGAPIVPGATEDGFPTHIDIYGQGGFRSVATAADLVVIPTARRAVGMKVFVRDEKQDYYLSSDLLTWLAPTIDGGNF